jgi:mono/diheme cytochrome c family protein
MRRLAWFVAGMLAVVIAIALAGGLYIRSSDGFSARSKPSAIEAWVARRARAMAIPADAKRRANPVPNTPEAIADGRAHWADHCAICHANNGSGDAVIGRSLYPPAPDMREPATQQMSDAEIFYIIENGIRLSGMPAWGGSEHGEEDSWKLVHFIRHLPQLSAAEEREMEALNPKGPDERREEQEEEEFLKGGESHETQPGHHH